MTRVMELLVVCFSLLFLPGWSCGEPVLDDPGFDLWCGNKLCSWEIDKGQVQRVATWHRSDYGVELIGDPAQISQLSPVTSSQTTCLLFELQADRDDRVSLQLEMDFLDDGKVEYSHDLPSDDWQPIEYKVRTPIWYSRVRFIVRKVGAGRAVVSHIRATKSSDCGGAPLPLPDRPDGAACGWDTDCLSRSCLPSPLSPNDGARRVCGRCSSQAPCPAPQVCGVEASAGLEPHLSCGAAARHQLGERCAEDAECATGTCCAASCAQCCDARPEKGCPRGGSCRPRPWASLGAAYQALPLPEQCSPGEKAGLPAEPCLRDDDCQSGVCAATAELKQCLIDGRRCQTEKDCPSWPACLPVGQLGGKCQ